MRPDRYGSRDQVWRPSDLGPPTIDSTNDATVTGSVGQHGRGLTIKGGLSQYAQIHPRIYLLDGEGQVSPELREVIQLVADAATRFSISVTPRLPKWLR